MKAPSRSVVVSVEWGYDTHECPMARRTWDRIVKGLPVRRVEPYWYEGKRFTGVWTFNSGGYGRLEVTYDDDGQAFVGSLDEACFEIDGSLVKWSDVALSNPSDSRVNSPRVKPDLRVSEENQVATRSSRARRGSAEKYETLKLARGWAVIERASRHIVETCRLKREAVFATSQYNAAKRPHRELTRVWLVGGTFVMEPYVGGQLIGEASELDMSRFVILQQMSHDQFDELVKEFIEENGYPPDS